jgi:hypothetical protein
MRKIVDREDRVKLKNINKTVLGFFRRASEEFGHQFRVVHISITDYYSRDSQAALVREGLLEKLLLDNIGDREYLIRTGPNKFTIISLMP